MTDKQIIIDGVDVSECEFCDWKGSNFPQCRIRSASFKSFCEGYKCYYKQLQREKQNSQEARDTAIKEFNRAEELKTLLKRKEQECEKLKKIINEAKNSKLDLKSFLVGEAVQNEYEQQLDRLKAENEEYKKDNQAMRNSSDLFCKNADKICRLLENKLDQLEAEKVKAEQKLERIKQVCKDYCKIMCLCETKETCESCINTEVLQIINEA